MDAGVGTYTRRTFDKDRYTIWSMSGEYHNIPTINGVYQCSGRMYKSKDAIYDEMSGGLSIDLTDAYKSDAEIAEYRRAAVIEDGKAVVTDTITSKTDGEVIFNLLCVTKPRLEGEGIMIVGGKTVEFDPSLEPSFDIPDCSWEETRNLPAQWGVENFYRIRLCGRLQAGKKQTFILAVCK